MEQITPNQNNSVVENIDILKKVNKIATGLGSSPKVGQINCFFFL